MMTVVDVVVFVHVVDFIVVPGVIHSSNVTGIEVVKKRKMGIRIMGQNVSVGQMFSEMLVCYKL